MKPYTANELPVEAAIGRNVDTRRAAGDELFAADVFHTAAVPMGWGSGVDPGMPAVVGEYAIEGSVFVIGKIAAGDDEGI